MTATINYLPEIPAPEQVFNYRGLKSVWVIDLPGIIIYSTDKEKAVCKAKKVSTLLRQLNNCD
jgi:hypothetical protein